MHTCMVRESKFSFHASSTCYYMEQRRRRMMSLDIGPCVCVVCLCVSGRDQGSSSIITYNLSIIISSYASSMIHSIILSSWHHCTSMAAGRQHHRIKHHDATGLCSGRYFFEFKKNVTSIPPLFWIQKKDFNWQKEQRKRKRRRRSVRSRKWHFFFLQIWSLTLRSHMTRELAESVFALLKTKIHQASSRVKSTRFVLLIGERRPEVYGMMLDILYIYIHIYTLHRLHWFKADFLHCIPIAIFFDTDRDSATHKVKSDDEVWLLYVGLLGLVTSDPLSWSGTNILSTMDDYSQDTP